MKGKRTNGNRVRDWESPFEWDFYPPGTVRSEAETLVILDYERGRESAELVERVKATSLTERERQVAHGLPHGRHEWRGEGVTGPWIPLVCFAAGDDFPAPWLSLSGERRRELLAVVLPWYQPPALPVFDYPADPEEAALLAEAARADDGVLCVFTLDRSLKKDAILGQFREWLARRDDVRGSLSFQGLRKPKTDLLALACWRLCKVPAARRWKLIPKHFNPQTRQGVEGAAKRAEAALRGGGFLPEACK